MVYDLADGYALLLGGCSSTTCGSELSGTWILAKGSWTSLNTTISPPARDDASIAYDGLDGYVLLFGGENHTSGAIYNDSWVFLHGNWTRLTTPSAPSPRFGAGMVYYTSGREVVLTGGCSYSACYNDTWTYSGGNWTHLALNLRPPISKNFPISDDPACGCVVFAADFAMSPYLYTWVFSNSAWRNLSFTRNAPLAGFAGFTYYPTLDGPVLFGGFNGSSATSYATWLFLPNESWVQLNPPDSPSGRYALSLVTDIAHGVMDLFGGTTPGGVQNDTWLFGLTNVSIRVIPPGDGSVWLNGTVAFDGQNVSVGLGYQPIAAQSQPWGWFSGWNSSGFVALLRPGGAPVELWVGGPGTLTASFAPYPGVTVQVDPPSCGNVTFGTVGVPNGTVVHILEGNYTVAAPYPCRAGLTFTDWVVTGRLQLQSSTTQTTPLTVAGNGTLAARYEAAVFVTVQPSSSGWVLINGTRYGNGSIAKLIAGSYPLATQSQPWSQLASVSAGGQLNARGSILTVAGNGQLTAEFTDFATLAVEVWGGGCGNVTVNGTLVTNASTMVVPIPSSLTVAAFDCAWGRFQTWQAFGGVRVTQFGSHTVQVAVTNNGTLEAVYVHAYCIKVAASPPSAGEIWINGSAATEGTACNKFPRGSYLLNATARAGYVFSGWSVGGNVTAVNGSLVVEGNGSVVAGFSLAPPKGSVSASGIPWFAWVAGGLAVAVGAALFFRRRSGRSKVSHMTPIPPSSGQSQDGGSTTGSTGSALSSLMVRASPKVPDAYGKASTGTALRSALPSNPSSTNALGLRQSN